jgi:hypothetical protein
MDSKRTRQNNDNPSTSTNDFLLGLPSASNNGECTTLVTECESYGSACTIVTKTDSRDNAEIWELLSSTSGERDDGDGELEPDISFSTNLSSPTTLKNEETVYEGVDKDVLDVLVLGDSDSFRLLSIPDQKEASRKRGLFQDGACGDIDDKLRQMHEKRARREASVSASPPDQHYPLQELRRKRPVCIFVNFLGTRCPRQEDEKEKSASSTTGITAETKVSSLKVSEFPESEPSDLPTKSAAPLITSLSRKKSGVPSPRLVTPEGLKMLKALGLDICPCKMNKKKQTRTMSFQANKDPSLSSCCFPALPLVPGPGL